MTPKYLVIPKSRWDDVKKLLSLSANQMRTVAKVLQSKETLKTEDVSYQRIAKDADISQADALAVLGAVTNLTLQRQRYSLSSDQLLDDLEAGAEIKVKEFDAQTKAALLDLLSESEEGYFVEKAESLKIGFSPHLVSVRSICDVRPIFDKARENIEGILLVTFLGLTMHDEEHKDHTTILQLGRSELRKLRESIEEAEKKLAVLEKEFGAKFDVFS